MSPSQLIRFIECVNNIKPAAMPFEAALRDLDFSEGIRANKAGLKAIEAHWALVLADRMGLAKRKAKKLLEDQIWGESNV